MDDPVAASLDGIRGQRLGVAVHGPVDGTVANGMDTDVEPGVMVPLDQGSNGVGVAGRIALVAPIHLRQVPVPVIVEPSGSGSAAPIDIEFDAAGNQPIIAGRLVRPGHRRSLRDQLLGRRHTLAPGPEDEDPDRQPAIGQRLSIRIPGFARDTRILDAGHALGVHRPGQLFHPVDHHAFGRWRNQMRHQVLSGFFENASRSTVRVSVDRTGRRILGPTSHAGQLEGGGVGHAVVPGGLRQPYWVLRRDPV